MIKSGATAWHRIKPGVDLNLISEIIITYKSASAYGAKIVMQRRYPSQTIVHGGDILVPLSQADTTMLREQSGNMVRMELQYNFATGAVGKSEIKTIAIGDTLATEYVDGSAPDAAQANARTIEFSAGDVIVISTGGGNLPAVDNNDNGKVLTVVDGEWKAEKLPQYDGTYSITPQLGEITVLATSGKYLAADVAVDKIPITSTSNSAGGQTVIIGT